MKIRAMRITAGLLAVLAGVLCFARILVASDDLQRGNPHAHFRNPDQCPKCHLSPDPRFSPVRISSESDAVCLGCHRRESMGRSHPVGERPEERHRKMKVPGDLPLDAGGRIICLTCHTAHGPYVSYFLRRQGPGGGFEPLCAACHGIR